MVYLRFPSFKTGMNPSQVSRFNLDNLTGKSLFQLFSRHTKVVVDKKQNMGKYSWWKQ